ncbi:MAG: response regulator [Gammaproteobacteria bacterium]|nr:response regulator [Gammaproteobacteria bacterium]
MPSPEVLAVLADEVSELDRVVMSALADMTTAAGNQDQFGHAVESYTEQIQRLAGACRVLELAGLQQVCEHLEKNLGLLDPGGSEDQRLIFDRWPRLALGYLRAPKDGVYSRELACYMSDHRWPNPMTDDEARQLEVSLHSISSEAGSDEVGEPRQLVAEAEDVQLKVAEDINPLLLDAFLTEGPLQAALYSETIQKIISGEGWADDVDEARRVVHAVKGAANTVGVRGVAVLCHHVEDILEYLADNAITPRGKLGRLLLAVADCLEEQFEALLDQRAEPPQSMDVLQRVLDVANAIDRGEIKPEDEKEGEGSEQDGDQQLFSAVAEPAAEPAALEEQPASTKHETSRQVSAPEEPRLDPQPAATRPVVEPKIRVTARSIDDMLRVSGEMAISRGYIQERLENSLKLVSELREREGALWDRANTLEGLVDTQGVAAGQRHAQAAIHGTSVVSPGFDPLEMDQYSELHTQVHGFVENIADLQLLGSRILDMLSEVGSALNQQTLQNNELHNLLMNSRMLPVSTLEPRLQRTVRQAAEKSGKSAKLVIEGGDVMLDDQMVNVLIDPIQHMLRNAVDHGLEKSGSRVDKGKDETGNIKIRFSRDGNYLVIQCSDDGAGLDLFRIHNKAVEQGLITDREDIVDEDIARLILKPGFSTSAKVTELSGRGVGMDIVNTSITRLKGSISIKTRVDQGVTFTLRLPISIGITHCLLAEAEHQVFAIPTDNLDRIVYGGASNIRKIGNRWFYKDAQDNCTIYSLGSLVGLGESQRFGQEHDQRPVILMRVMDQKFAIVVDKVTSGRDLVIKSMGRRINAIKGVIGASILGDGRVIPILEISDLVQQTSANGAEVSVVNRRNPSRADALDDILVVDDSLSVRTALSLMLGGNGFRVRTAKDGMDAIDEIKKHRPAAVLVDMEMPRMNGLELTMHIRGETDYRDIPVIMITSRTADKHRLQAKNAGVDHYVTKPYREADLLALLKSSLSEAA